jgi:predicted dienelactone hydrolase
VASLLRSVGVPNATHFAFLFICPPAMAKAGPDLCTDAPGFHRVAFHKGFDAAAVAFFRAHLINQLIPEPRTKPKSNAT